MTFVLLKSASSKIFEYAATESPFGLEWPATQRDL